MVVSLLEKEILEYIMRLEHLREIMIFVMLLKMELQKANALELQIWIYAHFMMKSNVLLSQDAAGMELIVIALQIHAT